MEDIQAPEIRAGIYKHYKGDLVEVYTVAIHSETLEAYVNYRHVSGAREGEPHTWVRPYDMFMETVKHEGQTMPRFEFLRET